MVTICKIKRQSSDLWPPVPTLRLVLQPPHGVAGRLVCMEAITMAWIPMRTDLAGDPAVLGMANALDIDPDLVVGKLHRFWSWADAQSRDGHASVTPTDINCVVGCDGFAQALEKVGWLMIETDYVTIPNWDNHLSRSAKKRAGGARRQQKRREVGNASVTPASHNDVTKALPHNSTVHNSKNPPTPLFRISNWVDVAAWYVEQTGTLDEPMVGDRWPSAWATWVQHRTELKKPLKRGQHLKAMVRTMLEFGPDRAIAAIEYTVAQGWQGLREPDGKSQADEPGRYRTNRDAENIKFFGGRADKRKA